GLRGPRRRNRGQPSRRVAQRGAHGLRHCQRHYDEPARHHRGADSRRRPRSRHASRPHRPARAAGARHRLDSERIPGSMIRLDGRTADAVRPTRIVPDYTIHAEGSVLIEVGRTKVICTASVEDRVPPFLRGAGKGWVTAEYGMLPRATTTRTQREATAGKVGGRTQEIQRLIGRSLRSVVTMTALGERTVWIDCDVIQADGGTRTAAITGGFVALVLALDRLRTRGVLPRVPVTHYVAATSVGVVAGTP